MITSKNPKFLHYMVSEREGKYIAHCLDYDLVAAAGEQEEALERLNFVVRSHVETAARYKNDLAVSHRAPKAYWECFEKAPCDQIKTLELKGTPIEARFEVGLTTAQLVHCEPVYAVR